MALRNKLARNLAWVSLISSALVLGLISGTDSDD